jgi:hypothetical protein
MDTETFRTRIDGERAENIVSAVRTSLGDSLRSVVYFTPSEFDVLYVRQDLYESPAAARESKSRLVDFEVSGFGEAQVRTAVAAEREPSSIGEYEFTVRFHEDGFVVRVLGGDAGVLFTTDAMDVNAFEDAETAVKHLLVEE